MAPVPRASATTWRQSLLAVTARAQGASPGDTPRLTARHPRIGEELGSREECGVVDRRGLDVARQRRPRQLGERAAVAGHVAHRGDAAVQRVPEALEHQVAPIAGAGVGGQVHVGVDEAGDEPAAPKVQHLRPGRRLDRIGGDSAAIFPFQSSTVRSDRGGAPVPSITVT